MQKTLMGLLMIIVLANCGTYNARKYPLHSAVSLGNIPQVRAIIDSGTSIEMRDKYGSTPLMTAIYYGQWDAVKTLVEMGADINAKDSNGQTPLFYAVSCNKPEVLSLLIQHGSILDARDNDGLTPLMFAADSGYWDTVKTLSIFGADINVHDSLNMTPLLYAIYFCQPEQTSFLISQGAKTNVRGENGLTAIHYAVLGCGWLPEKADTILDELIENGCNLSAVDKDGHSAYWKAMEDRLADIVVLLRKKGVIERFGGGSPVDLQTMAAEDCTYIVDGERSAGPPMWILGPIGYGAALLSDSIKIPKKYRECMEKMGFQTTD